MEPEVGALSARAEGADGVAVVMTVRERFSSSRRAIEDLYRTAGRPFQLIFVLPPAPEHVRAEILAERQRRGFRVVEVDRWLAPNAARNRGAAEAPVARFLVFIDNDVVGEPGWLQRLVRSAEETAAGAMGPVYLIGELAERRIHMTGGDISSAPGPDGRPTFYERHRDSGRRLDEVRRRLVRQPVDFLEFHCMLVSRRTYDAAGPFDEALTSAREHIDFCMAARAAGDEVLLEPSSLIAYLGCRDYQVADAAYHADRWSDERNRATLARFAAKHGLDADTGSRSGALRWLTGHREAICILPGSPRPLAAGAIDLVAHGLPQTNLQLYGRMLAEGYAGADLELVRRCYAAAAWLFDGLLRASGKPFLAHAVGTAGVLAAHGAPPRLLAAGMLHAAYTHGRLALAAGRAPSARRRAKLGRLAGRRVEEIAAAYAAQRWRGLAIPETQEDVERYPLDRARLLVMRAANDIEERLDYGLALTRKRVADDVNVLLHAQRILPALGYGALAAMLAEAHRRSDEARQGGLGGRPIASARGTYRVGDPRPSRFARLLRRLRHRLAAIGRRGRSATGRPIAAKKGNPP